MKYRDALIELSNHGTLFLDDGSDVWNVNHYVNALYSTHYDGGCCPHDGEIGCKCEVCALHPDNCPVCLSRSVFVSAFSIFDRESGQHLIGLHHCDGCYTCKGGRAVSFDEDEGIVDEFF